MIEIFKRFNTIDDALNHIKSICIDNNIQHRFQMWIETIAFDIRESNIKGNVVCKFGVAKVTRNSDKVELESHILQIELLNNNKYSCILSVENGKILDILEVNISDDNVLMPVNDIDFKVPTNVTLH